MKATLLARLAVSSIILFAAAERPQDQSLCDYYTETILGTNNEANQGLLLTLLTNTAVISNYTTPNTGVKVNGFANPGTFLGQNVSLVGYFNGGFNSTNDGGPRGVSKLFLDDGGPAALQKNMSSNGNKKSAQYGLLTHVNQYFGVLLGCSKQGGDIFPAYNGKYMDISYAENGYLIEQFVLSASSLGFSPKDAAIFNTALNYLFQYRCAPSETLIPTDSESSLQSICTTPDCPLHPRADCDAYPNRSVAIPPKVANRTLIANATVKGEEPPAATTAVAGDEDHQICIRARDLADDAAATACQSGKPTNTESSAAATSNAAISVVNVGTEAIATAFTLLAATLFGLLIT